MPLVRKRCRNCRVTKYCVESDINDSAQRDGVYSPAPDRQTSAQAHSLSLWVGFSNFDIDVHLYTQCESTYLWALSHCLQLRIYWDLCKSSLVCSFKDLCLPNSPSVKVLQNSFFKHYNKYLCQNWRALLCSMGLWWAAAWCGPGRPYDFFKSSSQ